MRRAGFLIELTEQHRRIWSHLVLEPELARVVDPNPPLHKVPITPAERMMVNFVLLHLHSTLEAVSAGLTGEPEALDRDIREFFTLPIPRAVWIESRKLRSGRTRRRVDDLLGLE